MLFIATEYFSHNITKEYLANKICSPAENMGGYDHRL